MRRFHCEEIFKRGAKGHDLGGLRLGCNRLPVATRCVCHLTNVTAQRRRVAAGVIERYAGLEPKTELATVPARGQSQLPTLHAGIGDDEAEAGAIAINPRPLLLGNCERG